MAKSTPRPMYNTAKATEIRFNSPTVRVAKAAVSARPVTRLITVTSASLTEPRPASRMTVTRHRASTAAVSVPLITLCISSWDSAVAPVRRRRAPGDEAMPRSS